MAVHKNNQHPPENIPSTVLEHLEQRQRGNIDLLRGIDKRRVGVRSSSRTAPGENPVQP